jgi:hypothetical protein
MKNSVSFYCDGINSAIQWIPAISKQLFSANQRVYADKSRQIRNIEGDMNGMSGREKLLNEFFSPYLIIAPGLVAIQL